jgi:hypothetical protein
VKPCEDCGGKVWHDPKCSVVSRATDKKFKDICEKCGGNIKTFARTCSETTSQQHYRCDKCQEITHGKVETSFTKLVERLACD